MDSYSRLAKVAAYDLKYGMPNCYQIAVDKTRGKLDRQYRELALSISLCLNAFFLFVFFY